MIMSDTWTWICMYAPFQYLVWLLSYKNFVLCYDALMPSYASAPIRKFKSSRRLSQSWAANARFVSHLIVCSRYTRHRRIILSLIQSIKRKPSSILRHLYCQNFLTYTDIPHKNKSITLILKTINSFNQNFRKIFWKKKFLLILFYEKSNPISYFKSFRLIRQ